MIVFNFYILFVCFTYINFITGAEQYSPDWKSLDARPLPSWYDEAKIGIFIHWGVYAVPSFGSEWFWINWKNDRHDIVDFMAKNYRPGFTYQDFASQFTAEFFDPVKWAKLFEESGAKYIIFTSKHHEGFTMWPSKYSFSWNSVDLGPHRNIIRELADAVRNNTKLHFGLYHSLFEWFNPLYEMDKENNWTTQVFVDNKIIPEMKELVFEFQPEIIWSDGEWEAPDTYWKSKEFLAWLYNDSPVKHKVVVNDRWGSNTLCKHGGFLTCADRYDPGVLSKRKFENALTIDGKSWGFRRNADLKDFLTTHEMISNLTRAISCNGNVAFNVGPTKEGIISPIYEERLQNLGKWLEVNGEGVYKSHPWLVCQNDTITPNVWYTVRVTQNGDVDLYAFVLDWPKNGNLTLGCPDVSSHTVITLLGVDNQLHWTRNKEDKLDVKFPNRADVHSDWAWTLKITGTSNTEIYKNVVSVSN